MYTSTKPLDARGKKIVYFALIFSTFIYCFMVWFLFANKQASGTLDQELHRTDVLVLMILSLAVFVFALRMPAGVTRWALSEAVCIWALVATFLTNDWRLFAAGWVLSLIAYALAFPSTEDQTTAP